MNAESSSASLPLPVPLSDAGALRRDEILGIAQDALRVRRAKRTALRAGGAAALLIAGVGAGLLAAHPWPARPASAVDSPPSPAPLAASTSGGPRLRFIQFESVQTRAITPDALVDDRGLNAAMSELGRPTGLVRTGGRTLSASEIAERAEIHRETGANRPRGLAPEGARRDARG